MKRGGITFPTPFFVFIALPLENSVCCRPEEYRAKIQQIIYSSAHEPGFELRLKKEDDTVIRTSCQHKRLLLDASSAILLAKAGFHETVATSYCILMSVSVFDEITRKGLPGSDEYRQLLGDGRLEVTPVSKPPSGWVTDTSLKGLDKGEQDTLVLFLEGQGDFVVTDDGAAARFCLKNKIPFVNSLLLLRVLHLAGTIEDSSSERGFQSLLDLGRYSEKVIEYAQNCHDRELLCFLP